MHNGYNQIYNRLPKPNSKAQAARKAAERPVERITCAECGKGDVTLYKSGDSRYCKEHLLA